MLFISLILAPALRRFPQDTRLELLRKVGTATKAVGWIAVLVLLSTGFLNIIHLQIQWNTFIGRLLMIKLTLVAVMIILSALHDFILGPLLVARQGNPTPQQPSIPRLHRLVPWLARTNLLLALGVIYLAVLIARS
jgi:putative copper export protein